MRDRNYCVCSDSASTVNKTAALDGFILIVGATVRVKFTETNTAASPTLNISNTGNTPIKSYGATAAGQTVQTSWYAGSVVTFAYDGTNWLMVDFSNRDGGTGLTLGETSTTAYRGDRGA